MKLPRPHRRFDLAGAVSVVTGASSGLGRRIALDLAARGAVVTAIARREHLLDEVVALMRQSVATCDRVVCDVSRDGELARLLREIELRRGRIDVLVNAAGIPEPDAADAVVSYRQVMDVNFFAPVAATLTVLPGMRARGHGAIVNVTSDAGRSPIPSEPAYGASKAALNAFTESLSYPASSDGVHLHLLYPGWVPTALTQRAGGPTTVPPSAVRRTEAQVARALLRGLGGARVDLDATRVARFGPVARMLVPSLYRRAVRRAAPR